MKKYNGFVEGGRYLIKNNGAYSVLEIEILKITKHAIKYNLPDKNITTTHWKLKEEFDWVPLEKLRKEKNIEGSEHGRNSNRSD
jgi:hypothetical protein